MAVKENISQEVSCARSVLNNTTKKVIIKIHIFNIFLSFLPAGKVVKNERKCDGWLLARCESFAGTALNCK
jgi:hypothetical protein